jgi:transcriptional regulator with XRE-family HTH domain
MAQTRLKQLREEAVLTVHELSEASGVSDDTISKIENGQRVARPSTLRKLAQVLNVRPQELRRPAKTEVLAGAGKDEAPREAGQTEAEVEEERPVIPQSVSSLERYIEDMKELKELREAELKEIGNRRGIGLRNALPTQMELADKGLRDLLDELGALDFAEAVTASREMADPEAIPLCHELLRRLAELEALSAQARAASGVARAGIHIEDKIGPSVVPTWMHKELQEQRSPES